MYESSLLACIHYMHMYTKCVWLPDGVTSKNCPTRRFYSAARRARLGALLQRFCLTVDDNLHQRRQPV